VPRPVSIVLAGLIAAIVVFIVVLIQGDGDAARVTQLPTLTPTPTLDPLSAADFFLEIIDPVDDEVVVLSPSFTIVGRTRADAVVSVNDLIVEPGVDGMFSATLALVEGPNIIEIVASVGAQDALDRVLAVIYAP
jgi:hypothetical protein